MAAIKPVWNEGTYSRQAHRDLPSGTFERELGREGFDGPATHMYHRRPPTSWCTIRGPMRPRAFNLNLLPDVADIWEAPYILSNQALKVSYVRWQVANARSLLRNADGDTLLFIHHGAGSLFCDYGHMRIEKADYICIPRGTMWRIESEEPVNLLLLEATNGSFDFPDRGLLGAHAFLDPARIDVPSINERFLDQQLDEHHEVFVKRGGEVSVIEYDYNPLDAIGWKGDLAPVRLNVRDICPVNSHRYHLPPSAHATFVSDRFLVSTFVPRPFETDPEALKIPFFHNNDDYDEVIFYHDGDFFSRDNIGTGYMTFHPSGITHGPHPKAQTKMFEQDHAHTNEIAVMLDARDPLTCHANGCEIEGYADTWRIP